MSYARTRREIDDFDADAANRGKAHTLQRARVRRKARTRGLELRHSVYGYSLIDATRTHVDGRSDFTLDEVEARLDKVSSPSTDVAAKRSNRRV